NAASTVKYTGGYNGQLKPWTYMSLVIEGGGSTYRNPGSDLFVGETFEVRSGTYNTNDGVTDRNLSVAGNIKISGGVLTVNTASSLSCSGNFSNAGTFMGGSSTNTFNKNWTNTGNYIATSGNTILDGALTFNNTGAVAFNANSGTVNFQNAGAATIMGNATFRNLTCTTAGKTLNFEMGSTQTIQGTLTITGGAGSLIKFRSTDLGAFTLDFPNGPPTVTYTDLQYCTAGTNTGMALNSLNSGNNTNWNFGGAVWTGTVNSDWEVGGNWDKGTVPVAGDDVMIGAAANQPVLSAGVAIQSLTVNTGSTLNLNGFDISVTAAVSNSGTIELSGAETVTFTGGLTNNPGSRIIYNGGFTGQIRNWTYRNLTIAGGAGDIYRLPGGNLTVAENLSITGGTFNTNDGVTNRNLAVTGNTTISVGTLAISGTSTLACTGTFSNSGIFTGGSGTHTYYANWTNTGNYTASSGNTVLSGGLTFNSTGGTFAANAGTVVAQGAGVTVFQGNTTFRNLSCTTAGKQLTFTMGSTQTIQGTLTITGAAGNLIRMRSSAVGAYTLDFPNGPQSVSYADLQYCVAGTNSGTASDSANSGNNVNWTFGIATWTGTVSTDWATDGNWDTGTAPVAGDNVMIPSAPSNQPVLSGLVSIKGLTVDSGATLDLAGQTITVAETTTNSGTIELSGGETITLTGGITHSAGSKVIYTGGYSGQIQNWSYRNLKIAGAAPDVYRVPAANLALIETLEVASGTFSTNDGAVDRNLAVGGKTIITGGTLALSGTSALTCTGSFANSGTFTGGSGIHTFNSDWTNTGNYTATSGSTILNSALTFNNTGAVAFVHNSGTLIAQGAGTVTFQGNTSFDDFTCTTAGKQLTFTMGSIQTIQGTLTITGTALNLIRLRSSGLGGYTLDFPNSPQTVTYADLEYCTAGTNSGIANDSTNSGNNVNWTFGIATWTGAVGTDWATNGNWDTGVAPVVGDSVVIANAANQPVLSGNVSVKSLTVNAGSTLDLNGHNLAVTNNVTSSGTIELTGAETVTAAGITNNAGSKVIYKGGYSGQIKAWTYSNLSIAAGGGDIYRIPGANLSVAETLEVASGTFNTNDGATDRNLAVSGKTIISGGTLAVAGTSTLTCTGTFSNAGTFTGGSGTHSFNADWTNSGNYQASSGSTLINGAIVFNNAGVFTDNGGTVTAQGVGTATFQGSTTFNNLTCTTAGKQLTFTMGSTQTISGTLTVTGAAGSLVKLRSSAAGAYTLDFPNGPQTVTYADLQYCVAGTNSGTADDSADSGNNVGWTFGIATWIGTVSTDWAVNGNWDTGVAPVAGDNVVIANATNQPILSGVVSVKTLTIHSGSTLKLNGQSISVTGTTVSSGTIELSGSETTTLTGGITNNPGSKVTYTGGYSGQIKNWIYQNLKISGGGGDIYRIPGANLEVAGTLEVAGGTLNTNDGAVDRNLVVNGNTVITAGTLALNGTSTLTCTGTFSNAGTFTGGGTGTHSFNDDWTNSGTYTATSGNTVLNSTGLTFNNSGTFNNNNGTVTIQGTGVTVFQGNTIFNHFTCTTAGKQMTFTAGTTQTISGTLTVTGAAGNLVKLRSSAAGAYTLDFPNGVQTVTYADLEYCTAGTNSGMAITSFNGGNNTNWTFGGVTWIGTVSTDWAVGANWDSGVVPVAGAGVVIAPAARQPSLSGAVTVQTLTIAAGSTLNLNGKSLTVNAATNNSGTIELSGSETTTLTGGLTSAAGSRVLYHGGYSGPVKDWVYRNLTIAGAIGDVYRTPGANLTVSEALEVESGTFNTNDGTIDRNLTLNGNTVVTGGSLVLNGSSLIACAGTISNSGTFTGGSGTHTFNGDWTNTGNFTATSGDTILNGALTFDNSGTFNANNGTVIAQGAGEIIFQGDTTFHNFTCTTAGKQLTFTMGSTQTVAGTLTITGAAGNTISMRSSGAGTYTLDFPNGPQTVSFADLQYCVAGTNAGTANSSINSGNNVNWSFGNVTWNGSVSSDWADGGNWDSGVTPVAGADVVIAAGTPNQPVLSGNVTVQNLTIAAGATLDLNGHNLAATATTANNGTIELSGSELITITGGLTNAPGSKVTYTGGYSGQIKNWSYSNLEIAGGAGDTYRLPGTNLAISETLEVTSGSFSTSDGVVDLNLTVSGKTLVTGGTLTVSGTSALTGTGDFFSSGTVACGSGPVTFSGRFVNNGTFTGGTGTHTFGGDWSNSSNYTATSGNTVLNGTLTFNNTGTITHNSGTVTAQGAGNVTIQGNTIFRNLSCTTAGKQLTFAMGSTQTVQGTLTVTGTSGNLVLLRSSGAGAYTLDFPGSGQTVNYADIQYCTAGTNQGTANNSRNSGSNTNWIFGALTWTGAVNTDWANAGNWNSGTVPGTYDGVEISATGNQPVLSGAVSIADLSVGGGATLNLNGQNFAVSGVAANSGTIELSGAETITITGGLTNAAGSKVVYSGGYSGQIRNWTYSNLEISGGAGDVYRLPGADLAIAGNLEVISGTLSTNDGAVARNLTVSGDIALTGGTLAVSGTSSLACAGAFNSSGTFTGGGTGTHTYNGNWTSTGTYAATSGNTVLNGAVVFNNAGTFTSGGGTVTAQGAGTAVIQGNTTFNNLVCTTAGKQLTFAMGSTQTVQGTLTVTGTSGNLVFLRSSGAGPYTLDFPNGTQAVSYADLQYCTAGTNSGAAIRSQDSGNNNNWIFGGFTWTGAVSTDWNDIGNWSSGIVPTASDEVIIAATVNQPALVADTVVGSLQVNAGATLDTGAFDLTVSGGSPAFIVDGTLEIEAGTAITTPTLNDGSSVEYAGGTGSINNWTYRDLGITGAGTYSLPAAVTVTDDFRIIAGTLDSAYAMNVAGEFYVGPAAGINATNNITVTGPTLEVAGILNSTGPLTCSGEVLISGDATVSGPISAGNLTVSGSMAATGDTTVTDDIVNSGTMTLSGDTTLGGSLGNTGTINADNGILTLNGSWDNTGTFNSGSSEVVLQGPGIATISGSTSFDDLTCRVAGKNIVFEAGMTQEVKDKADLSGTPGNYLVLRSSAEGDQWGLSIPNGNQTLFNVNVRDAVAEPNFVTCFGSVDSGNNENWNFSILTLKTPEDDKQVGPEITVVGEAVPNTQIDIKNVDTNQVLATTETLADGSFMMTLSEGLTPGDNTLVPILFGIEGAEITVHVLAEEDLTPDIVPVVSDALDDFVVSEIAGQPLITGEAKAGQTVELIVRNTAGTVLVRTLAVTEAQDDGSFAFDPGDYISGETFGKGTNEIVVIVDGVGSKIRPVNIASPYGVIYDSVTGEPIQGATIGFFKSGELVTMPGGLQNPQVTESNGQYKSMIYQAGTYDYDLTAFGYTYSGNPLPAPGAKAPGRTIGNAPGHGSILVDDSIQRIDFGMAPSDTLLDITMSANKSEAVVGEVVTYTVTLATRGPADVSHVRLENKLPPGFKYLNGKVLLNNLAMADPTGTATLEFDIGTVTAGNPTILRYQVVVGSGVTFGNYANHAFARRPTDLDASRSAISNKASCTVRVIMDPLFDLGLVIGKVFWDRNENGIQDEGEQPLAHVRLVTEDGTVIVTDSSGRYHIPAIVPGRHLVRLDERSLPDGAYLTTEKVQIVNVTQGMTVKANFGVNSIDSLLAGMMRDPVRIEREEAVSAKLNADIRHSELYTSGGAIVETTEIGIFCNYPVHVTDWKVRVIRKKSRRVVKTFEGGGMELVQLIPWDGKSSDGNILETGEYLLILTVTGKDGNRDVTNPKVFTVKEFGIDSVAQDLGSKGVDRAEWIRNGLMANGMGRQNIKLSGGTVRVSGLDLGRNTLRVFRGSDPAVGLLPVTAGEGAHDAPELSIVLPDGDWRFEVSGETGESMVGMDGSMGVSELPPYEKFVRIGSDRVFYVAMIDTEFGYHANRGQIEPLTEADDSFGRKFWIDGKASYYIKGKILGKYLVTSSFDSDRNQKQAFRDLDPEKFYPVYGDESTVNYEAGDTSGRLYVMVEGPKGSKAQWGNYGTGLTDTDLAQYNRTLYGGKLDWRTVSENRYGEPYGRVIAFQADVRQKAAHVEFLGTGGSLFYLKHQDVVEGSEKIRIEIRDKITGLVLSNTEQRPGVDYDIEYSQGRIVFRTAVTSSVDSGSLIGRKLLDGHPVFVVADYEYEQKDRYDEGSRGVRGQAALGDFVKLGGTYVEEEMPGSEYTLKAGDAVMHFGKRVTLRGEIAESESEGTGSFVSTDGGLHFVAMPGAEGKTGRAESVSGEGQFNWLGFSAYYQNMDRNFYSPAVISQQGKETIGGGFVIDLSDSTQFKARYDVQKLLEDGNPASREQLGAQKTEAAVAQLTHVHNRLRFTSEYRELGVEEKRAEYASETNAGNRDRTAAFRVDYSLSERAGAYVEHQETISGNANHVSTGGFKVKMGERWRTDLSFSDGTNGNAAKAELAYSAGEKLQLSSGYTWTRSMSGLGRGLATTGWTYKLNDRMKFTGNYAWDTEAGEDRSSQATVGVDGQINEKTSVRSTYAISDSDSGDKVQSLSVGTTRKLSDDLNLTADRTFARTLDRIIQSDGVSLAKDLGDGRKLEAKVSRQKAQGDREYSDSNIFGLSGTLNDRWSGSLQYEKGDVQNLDGTTAKRQSGALGLGFAELDAETGAVKLKASLKGEIRLDNGLEDQSQYLVFSAVEGKLDPDMTLFAKAHLSRTHNRSTASQVSSYKEMVFGTGYRPVLNDKLNLIGRYTYIEGDGPAEQINRNDIEETNAHVVSVDAVYDLGERLSVSGKYAARISNEKVTGFDFAKTRTWLVSNRFTYSLDRNNKVAAEYRVLAQREAHDRKSGALIEYIRRMNETVQVGVGYNFTDFNDDLARLDYKYHGPFVNLTGAFYDRAPEEKKRRVITPYEERIKSWSMELVKNELSRQDSPIMSELTELYSLAQEYTGNGMKSEAVKIYARIKDVTAVMYEEAEAYVRKRVELEYKLRE
ncbi:MAG: hypothetical protein PHQ23_03395, partial [Candidatus Wallbacteria bacterium]|nr:hypothetical protein [Candidatus Wallbacteria bacterium]